MQMAAGMIQAADNQVFLRAYATVQTIATAASLGAVSLDADPDDGEWTSELDTGSDDAGTAFGKRQMTPHPLAKRIKLSNKLLRLVADVEGLVDAPPERTSSRSPRRRTSCSATASRSHSGSSSRRPTASRRAATSRRATRRRRSRRTG
jgi:hypothetical protein